MLDTTSNAYNNLLKIYSDQLNKLKSYKKEKIALRSKSLSLKEDYNYEDWFSEVEDKESNDKALEDDLPPYH